MISLSELVQQISGTIGKTKVLELGKILREQQFEVKDLVDLTFHQDHAVAFRAAWILENLFLKDPLFYEKDLEYLLSRIKDIKHASCQRHYVKIIMNITGDEVSEVIKAKLLQIDLEPVVEQLFDWLIDLKVKIAVKVLAADSLFNLRGRYPWISDELGNQVQFMLRNGSPAIQFRGRKILKKLT